MVENLYVQLDEKELEQRLKDILNKSIINLCEAGKNRSRIKTYEKELQKINNSQPSSDENSEKYNRLMSKIESANSCIEQLDIEYSNLVSRRAEYEKEEFRIRLSREANRTRPYKIVIRDNLEPVGYTKEYPEKCFDKNGNPLLLYKELAFNGNVFLRFFNPISGDVYFGNLFDENNVVVGHAPSYNISKKINNPKTQPKAQKNEQKIPLPNNNSQEQSEQHTKTDNSVAKQIISNIKNKSTKKIQSEKPNINQSTLFDDFEFNK